MFFAHTGIVVCGEVGSNVLRLVFSDIDLPLYFLPRHLEQFDTTSSKIKNLSKTAVAKRERVPSIGECIEFNVDDSNKITVFMLMTKAIDREFTYGRNGALQTKTRAVVSPRRRCWSYDFGYISVPEKYYDIVMPNVIYSTVVILDVDLAMEHEPPSNHRLDLSKFRPKLKVEFVSFGLMEINDSFLRSVPWNRNAQFVINMRDFEMDAVDVVVEQIDEYKNFLINVTCLILDGNDVFCPSIPNQRVKMGNIYNKNICYRAGCQYVCSMYPCRYNNCWIIYQCCMRSQTERFPIDHEEDGTLLILVPLLRAFSGLYYNQYTGYVTDLRSVLPEQPTHDGCLDWTTGLMYPSTAATTLPVVNSAPKSFLANGMGYKAPVCTETALPLPSIPCRYWRAWVKHTMTYPDSVSIFDQLVQGRAACDMPMMKAAFEVVRYAKNYTFS